MRLLFDRNLSRHLVRQLAVEFPGSEHVTGVGLDTATDVEIWKYAADQGDHGAGVVTEFARSEPNVMIDDPQKHLLIAEALDGVDECVDRCFGDAGLVRGADGEAVDESSQLTLEYAGDSGFSIGEVPVQPLPRALFLR